MRHTERLMRGRSLSEGMHRREDRGGGHLRFLGTACVGYNARARATEPSTVYSSFPELLTPAHVYTANKIVSQQPFSEFGESFPARKTKWSWVTNNQGWIPITLPGVPQKGFRRENMRLGSSTTRYIRMSRGTHSRLQQQAPLPNTSA